MSITFPHSEIRIRAGEPVMFMAEVNGRRIDVRIEWAVVEALSGARDAETIRRFVETNRGNIEAIAHAHLLAQGVPLGATLELDARELAGLPRTPEAHA